MRSEHGLVKRRYRIAATLSGVAVLVSLLLMLFLLAGGETGPTGPIMEPPIERAPPSNG